MVCSSHFIFQLGYLQLIGALGNFRLRCCLVLIQLSAGAFQLQVVLGLSEIGLSGLQLFPSFLPGFSMSSSSVSWVS